jgi:hypothetical protein
MKIWKKIRIMVKEMEVYKFHNHFHKYQNFNHLKKLWNVLSKLRHVKNTHLLELRVKIMCYFLENSYENMEN